MYGEIKVKRYKVSRFEDWANGDIVSSNLISALGAGWCCCLVPGTCWILGSWSYGRSGCVTKTNICPLCFLSFDCLSVCVPIQLYRPNNFDNYLFNFGIVSPCHYATVTHAVYSYWGWPTPSGLITISHYAMSLISSELFAVLSSWALSCGEKTVCCWPVLALSLFIRSSYQFAWYRHYVHRICTACVSPENYTGV
jgi:hypothetical protein